MSVRPVCSLKLSASPTPPLTAVLNANDGMARFVDQRYGATEDWGVMVGYVQEASTAGIEPRINGFVNAHAMMGAGHELIPEATNAHSEKLRSSHTRPSGNPIRLDHIWVVLR